MRNYLAYGLSISSDLELGSRLVEVADSLSELTVLSRPRPCNSHALKPVLPVIHGHGRELSLLTDGQFAPSVAHQAWCFEAAGVARFYWYGGQDLIEYERLENGHDELLAFWLIHIFLPLWSTLEGKYEFIHACAVEIANSSVLFMAQSTGGKSTLVDYFIKKGHKLVSDDKVAVIEGQGDFLAVPSHPNHRPYRKFEDLGKRVTGFAQVPLPISMAFSLRRAERESRVEVKEVMGHRKFALMRPSYLFDFGFLKEKRLEYLAKMAAEVPVFELAVPWDLNRLEDVYAAVCQQRQSIM